MSARRKLSPRERRFVELRASGLNGTEAIRAMGFKGRRPDIAASKLSVKPEVEAALEEKIKLIAAKVGVTQEEWFREVWAVAKRDVKRITGADKNKALELAGRHLGALKDTAGEREVIGPGLTVVVQQIVQQSPGVTQTATAVTVTAGDPRLPGPAR